MLFVVQRSMIVPPANSISVVTRDFISLPSKFVWRRCVWLREQKAPANNGLIKLNGNALRWEIHSCVSEKKFPHLNSPWLCQISTDFLNFCTAGNNFKKKNWKSVKIWQSYSGEFKPGNFFETQCSSKLTPTADLDWPLCHCAMAQAPLSTNTGAPFDKVNC